MNDQAKRWTAIDRGIYHGKDLVACGNKVWGKLSDDCATASRLAACADLLRGHSDLSAVAVMTWADVEHIRANATVVRNSSEDRGAVALMADLLALLPVPPKGDA